MDQLFKAKAWALLHDPPHKMWTLGGKVRCFPTSGSSGDRVHERESMAMWEKMRLRDVFGDVINVKDLVERADVFASIFDRWLIEQLAKHFGGKGPVFHYYKLHNLFDPKKSRDLEPPSCNRVGDYADLIGKALAPFISLPPDERERAVYHAFYAVYETAWINLGLPPSLAETRIPTHTLFDHAYSTASVLNVLKPNGVVEGYLVRVDIPGIQRVVNAARKAGDFWAGSWLVSMAMWLTLWPLVWEHGPDIVILPTLRLNPLYYTTVLNKLGKRVDVSGIRGILSDFFFKTIFKLEVPGGGDGMLQEVALTAPLMPGTAVLLLPEMADIERNFSRALNCLVEWAFGGRASDELCEDVLPAPRQSARPYLKVAGKIFAEFKATGLFDDLLYLKVDAVNVGEAYECLKEVVFKDVASCQRGDVVYQVLDNERRFVQGIKAIFTTSKTPQRDLEDLAKFLTFDAAFRSLHAKARESARRRLVLGKPWFRLTNSRVERPSVGGTDPYSKYVFYNRSDVGFAYCSVCGDEPAVIRLVKAPGGEDYGADAKAMLQNEFGCDWDCLRDLLKQIKPGEALGPLCLLKRALYYRLVEVLGRPAFDSTEDVAFAWYATRINLGDSVPDHCRKAVEYALRTERARDAADLCPSREGCNLETARGYFNKCVEDILGPRLYEEATRAVKTLMADLGVEGPYLARADPAVLQHRSYYAIIRGDADNVGKLLNGEIPVGHQVQLLKDLACGQGGCGGGGGADGLKRAYEELASLVEVLGRFVVTPTYLTTISISLAVTALRDLYVADFKYYAKGAKRTALYTGLIFSGGDDVLALAPVELALAFVKDMRRNYWGDVDGFHKIENYYFAAPAVEGFGRSFSVRFANIMDHMGEEIRKAAELLEEAKAAVWGPAQRKDSIVVSDSRSGVQAVLPLRLPPNGLWAPDYLDALFVARIGGVLSSNLPEDYAPYAEAFAELAVRAQSWDQQAASTFRDMWRRLLERNIKAPGEKRSEVLKSLELGADLTTLLKGDAGSGFLLDELVKTYQVLRGYP